MNVVYTLHIVPGSLRLMHTTRCVLSHWITSFVFFVYNFFFVIIISTVRSLLLLFYGATQIPRGTKRFLINHNARTQEDVEQREREREKTAQDA